MGIGEQIRKRREELGWTQQHLADLMGYKHKSTINKIEAGINDVNQKKTAQFSQVLGVPIEYLLGMDDQEDGYYTNPETATVAQELFDDPNLRVLFDAARDSKPEDLKMAADLLRRLKETNPYG